jgi:hypothetical protein
MIGKNRIAAKLSLPFFRMKREVELYKIGTVLGGIAGKKPTMMVVSNAGEPCDTYVKILREHCSEEYSLLKTDKAIIGTPKMSIRSHVYEGHSIKGFLDGAPKVGESVSLGHWRTSTVDRIIEDCIIVTKNSVYAIHDLSLIRDKKLKELGL